jgi:hypothetical protein
LHPTLLKSRTDVARRRGINPKQTTQKKQQENMKSIRFTIQAVLALAALAVFNGRLFALDPGLFELDGNAVTNNTTSGLPDDWDRINPGPGFHGAVSSFVVDPAGATIFTTGGSKDVQDITQWKYTTGSVPDKDDITDAFAAAYVNSSSEVVLYFGADRFDNSGDSQIGFWFFKSNVTLNPNGTFNGAHSVGDILILSDFTTGGAISTIRIFEWVGSGGSDGPLNLVASGGDNLAAVVNSGPTPAPWPYTPKMGTAGTFPTGTFFEGGVNLTKVLPSLECFTSFLAETRSSQSVTATLKDFVVGSFNFAPTVSVNSATVCQGTTATLTATVTGGVGAPAFSWTGPGGFTATTQSITVFTAGTYTVTVSSAPGCSVQASGTLTVNPNPNCSITPPVASICAGSTQTFTVSVTGGTAPYKINWTGPGGFVSNSTSITVSVAGTYTVGATDAKGCFTSCSATLIVNPTPSVAITGPAGCQTAPAMITATVTSGTSPFKFSWTGPGGFTSSSQTIAITTGGTYSVKVTDANGCQATASRGVGLCLQ